MFCNMGVCFCNMYLLTFCVFCLCTYVYCFVVISLFCGFFVCFVVVLCIFIFVCTSVGLLPPGESPVAVNNNNNNNNKLLTNIL
jgi:RsiW-degrading membrane proteinase PrsW (M82 family)